MRYTFMSDGYAAVKNDVCYEDQNEDYCGDAIDKLAAYEDAEEQGQLVILPCKVGDTIFAVEGRSVYKARVESMTFRDDGLWLDGTFNHFGMVCFSGEIGRNIFLTREEAEAALKGERKDV